MTEIIASVLGGLIGGLFTFLGVWMTIRYENKKSEKEECRLKKEKEELQYQNRPRLEIMDYTEIKKYSNNDQADISVILCPIEKYEDNGRAEFYYDSAVIEPEKWVCATYYLRNTGHTEIDHL